MLTRFLFLNCNQVFIVAGIIRSTNGSLLTERRVSG